MRPRMRDLRQKKGNAFTMRVQKMRREVNCCNGATIRQGAEDEVGPVIQQGFKIEEIL